ncbi:hypothetical protein [Lichenicola sp.]|uniref:hypothetical protein n=1 Tax=Lichenicola sp. TaxID=2804529 RepID=UPI003AFF986A
MRDAATRKPSGTAGGISGRAAVSGVRSGLAGLAVTILALTVGGCTMSGFGPSRAADASPATLIDGYLIARGMALSYGHSGRAGPAEIAQLIQYDRAALAAVVTAELEPGDARSVRAERALQALVDFTGDNDLRPDPTPGLAAPSGRVPP